MYCVTTPILMWSCSLDGFPKFSGFKDYETSCTWKPHRKVYDRALNRGYVHHHSNGRTVGKVVLQLPEP